MIIVNLKGGLGNQMFQVALAYSLSKDLKTEYLFDTSSFTFDHLRNFELNLFHLGYKIAKVGDVEKVKKSKFFISDRIKRKLFKIEIPYFRQSIIIESTFLFDKNLFKIKSNCYLDGYFQTEKYFLKYKKDLIALFQIKEEPNAYYSEIIDVIKNKECVSIHIRRGDYVVSSEANSFHGLISLKYYKSAIDEIKSKIENPYFVIISDDIDWCKLEFSFLECLFVENGRGNDYEDLRLMKYCKHNIIANSSFSWWGAWLNENPDKIVIAPKQWFLNEQFQSQTEDLKPSSWIQL
jgi:hypothetical protein